MGPISRLYILFFAALIFSPTSILSQQVTDGYRGIWFTLGQFSTYGDKYSGGLGTYTANHVPTAIFNKSVYSNSGRRNYLSPTLVHSWERLCTLVQKIPLDDANNISMIYNYQKDSSLVYLQDLNIDEKGNPDVIQLPYEMTREKIKPIKVKEQ
jgi:hypothetical protein